MSQPPLPPPPLVGSILERSAASDNSFKATASTTPSGFPAVQHRSKSAFARAREAKRLGHGPVDGERGNRIPNIHRSGEPLSNSRVREKRDVPPNRGVSVPLAIPISDNSAEEEWKAQMRRDNDRAVEAMSEEERERHAAEILEQLGPNVGELLQKAHEARASAEARPVSRDDGPEDGRPARKRRNNLEDSEGASESGVDAMQMTPVSPRPLSKLASPPRGILVSSTPSSRASSPGRSARKLRFAAVTPDNVHVYQSEPSSPRKPLGLLLPPPSIEDDANKVSQTIPRYDVKMSSSSAPEEGTPEDIRRRFFPHLTTQEPALEWIESSDSGLDSEPRFDLSGAIIPAAERDKLPTHLGLHHHGGSSSAGYTLSDLLLLARSSVPAQRATVLGVLSKLVQRVVRQESDVSQLKDHNGIRSKTLLMGLTALSEKGSVGVNAIDLVWSCITYWDEEQVGETDGVELRSSNTTSIDEKNQPEGSLVSNDPISSLPFPTLLQEMTLLFSAQALPPESLSQLLAILYRFARHSVVIATAIAEFPGLISSVVNTFLLTPIPPPDEGPLPNSIALDFLRTLALSSRANARALEGPADAILRFITTAIPLTTSPFPRPLAESLLRGTLDFYSTLGKYGIYSGIAMTASEHFNRLSSHVLTSSKDISIEVRVSWLNLLSVWMVCARDPHRTTPTHDLLWSQVIGWGWGENLLEFRTALLSGAVETNHRLWGALYAALSSWLEGCRLNSSKAGQEECEAVSSAMGTSWLRTLETSVAQLRAELSDSFSKEATAYQWEERLAHVSGICRALADFTRLCLACLPIRPPQSTQTPEVPPWILEAFSHISSAASTLLSHSSLKWIKLGMDDSRESLLSRIKILHLRTATDFLASFVRLARYLSTGERWLPEGIVALEVLLPGDESSAGWLVDEIVNRETTNAECPAKLQFLMPFFKQMICPNDTYHLSPLSPTSESIQRSTTQCLPVEAFISSSSWQKSIGLPLPRDWPCTALDHLLRSGTSPILTNSSSVPDSWNASETDLTQASLSLLLHVQETINTSDTRDYAPSFGHVVFNCMKVFMLEHNQQQSDSNEEVFRDTIVGRLMDSLLRHYTLGRLQIGVTTLYDNLETAAKEFLGTGTPFFQLYTDFVALYDAISFSHNTFARLLLPPTSMAYALDYRKLLWGDFGHTLRTIRTPVEEVPTVDIEQHFWPVETDAEMLGWYLRALVKWPLVGFVHMVAVHHVACNIWPDLRDHSEVDPASQKRARMLLVAIFKQAQTEVIKDVVRYVQTRNAALLLPPDCYSCSQDTKRARVEAVRGLGETEIAESVANISSKEP